MSTNLESVIRLESESSPSLAIEYPKPLPNFKPGAVVDEAGFSLSEKLAMRQLVELIKPFRRRYGNEIFYNFLMDHPAAIDRFRVGGDIQLSALHQHVQAMMRFFIDLVEKGLSNTSLYLAMCNDIVTIHRKRSVTDDQIILLMGYIKDYILEKMNKQSSASLANCFDKLASSMKISRDTGSSFEFFTEKEQDAEKASSTSQDTISA